MWRYKMNNNLQHKHTLGHLIALLTILLWGTTFISTKVLLAYFEPVEILIFRFIIGFTALFLVCPRRLKKTTARQEVFFAAAGLCGICLYYLLENIALTFTLASNIGVIVSVSPFFTALLTHLLLKGEEGLKKSFFIGFLFAMAGIFLLSTGGTGVALNPAGDLLALLASVVWAFYSVLTKKIAEFGYHIILTTRRIFFYGILFMIPAMFFFDFHLKLNRFSNPVCLINILFLGLGASALCFVTWNFSVRALGPVKTSVYIYMIPVITVCASVLILHETITLTAALGILLTLAGLFLSEQGLGLEKIQKWLKLKKNKTNT